MKCPSCLVEGDEFRCWLCVFSASGTSDLSSRDLGVGLVVLEGAVKTRKAHSTLACVVLAQLKR